MLSLAEVVVAMNLSKIYRGTEIAELKEFHFCSFGAGGTLTAAPHAFVSEQAPKSKTTTTSAAAPQPALVSKQELDDAYARGQRDALENAAQKLESAAKTLATTLSEVSRLRTTLAENSRQDMLRLVMVIAEQVIHREVSVNPEVVVKVIEEALKASVRADHYRIKINPADVATVNEQKPLFLASISGLKNLMIEADPSVAAGGCRIESDLGEVDATLETQLDAIRQALHETATEVS